MTVGKLNVDENPNVSFKFQIRGIPTILIFKGGQVVESVVGLAQKDDLKKVLDKHICDDLERARAGIRRNWVIW